MTVSVHQVNENFGISEVGSEVLMSRQYCSNYISSRDYPVHQESWLALQTAALDPLIAGECDQQRALSVTYLVYHQEKLIGALQPHD